MNTASVLSIAFPKKVKARFCIICKVQQFFPLSMPSKSSCTALEMSYFRVEENKLKTLRETFKNYTRRRIWKWNE